MQAAIRNGPGLFDDENGHASLAEDGKLWQFILMIDKENGLIYMDWICHPSKASKLYLLRKIC